MRIGIDGILVEPNRSGLDLPSPGCGADLHRTGCLHLVSKFVLSIRMHALNDEPPEDPAFPFVGTPWHKHVPARLERI